MGADLRHGFSSHLIRCQDFHGTPGFFIGSELSFEAKLNAVIDALYMLNLEASEKRDFEFGLMYGGHSEQELLIQILSNLNHLIQEKVKLSVFIDFERVALPAPSNFEKLSFKLKSRLALIDKNRAKPTLIDELIEASNDPALQWSTTSLNDSWIGHIDGIQFCTVNDEGEIRLSLDESPRAKRIMLEQLSQHGFDFDSNTDRTLGKGELQQLIAILQNEDTVSRLQECISPQRVRARVIRKKARFIPGQSICEDLPCLWSNNPVYENTAHLLFCAPERTYTVHFEISTGGRIQNNFRYGILKTALDAHFVRTAREIHPWLENQGISPESCLPILAFPKLTSARARSRFSQLTALAELFGVKIVQVKGSTL